MPYINQERRNKLDQIIPQCMLIHKPGELNYKISSIIRDYWYRNGREYQTINDILGALEGAKLEFYRRVAVPYEEQKIKENGDIY